MASRTPCGSSSRPFGIDVVIIEPGAIRTEWKTISRESLVESSRGGAYEDRAVRMRAMMERADGPRTSSPPSTVTKKIVKAALTNNPRARYPVGRGAGTIVRARKVLPDAAMDLLIRSQYK